MSSQAESPLRPPRLRARSITVTESGREAYFEEMKVLRDVANLAQTRDASFPNSPRYVVTVGNFDGVHLGHQALIGRTVEWAKSLGQGTRAALMTFEPHPRQILKPETHFTRLFSLKDQEDRIRALGVDVLILQPFSRDLSDLTPEAFLAQLILRPLNPAGIAVGYDFSFGRNRAGTIEVLQKWGLQMGVPVEIIAPVRLVGEVISSTRIRQALADGNVNLANQMLNRFFQIDGWIERGAGRGRTIGIPTANINSVDEVIPRGGVYVTECWARDQWRRSVTNIGSNPTFQKTGTPPRVETHILDFNEDLYGEKLQVRFLDRIREEKKFSSAAELVAQIQLDMTSARAWTQSISSSSGDETGDT